MILSTLKWLIWFIGTDWHLSLQVALELLEVFLLYQRIFVLRAYNHIIAR